MAEAATAPARLTWSEEDLLADHHYASPHVEAGLLLHGGLDADGRYVSPRTLNRWPAVRAWQAALADRGGELLDADETLLSVPPFPNEAQARWLIEQGLGRSLWDSLTITGIIEARGVALVDFTAPDFAELTDADLSTQAIGHLNAGLLTAHGWDEGGRAGTGEGAHDAMWFAARDLIFGADAYPVPEAPASIARPVDGREMPMLPEAFEGTLKLLMNVLMIEVRAERTFRFYEAVIGTPGLFDADAAARALEMIDRIRTDEAIHVEYLRTVISEFRALDVRTVDGTVVPGAKIVDPVWERMVRWHAVEVHDANRPAARERLAEEILALDDGAAKLAAFDALAT
jgi:hypothetical protein